MIYFVAATKHQNLFNQVINDCGEKIIDHFCGDHFNFLKFVMANFPIVDSADVLLLDLTACEDSDEEIIQAFQNLKIMNDKIRIIVVDPDRYEGDEVLSKCFAAGIYDIIVTEDNVQLKEELSYCIRIGKKYKDSTEFQNYIPYSEYQEKKNQKPEAEDVLIGLAGTHERIGVTHSTIILANYLRKKGYLVALIDRAEKPTFMDIEESFDCESKKDFFTLDGVDYYRNGDVEEIKGKGYNFILIDFGEYLKRDLPLFEKCDLCLIIAGAKPWEVEKTTNVFQNTLEEELKEYHYYFNFVSEDLKEEVRAGMGILQSVHFLKYAEDPFNSFEFPDIDEIFKRYKEPVIEDDTKKRKGFLKKG